MANESAIRAGKAYIELFADDSKLVRGMQAAEAKLKAFGNNVASIGKKMMLGGMGIVGSLFGASKVYADVGSRIKDMSDRTGLGAVAVQELAYAAEQSGADMATLETGVRKMQRAIVEAGQGAAGPTDALATLGLTAAELAGKSPDQQLALIGAADGHRRPGRKGGRGDGALRQVRHLAAADAGRYGRIAGRVPQEGPGHVGRRRGRGRGLRRYARARSARAFSRSWRPLAGPWHRC